MKKKFRVHYELLPMRAIFHRDVVAMNDTEAIGILKEQLKMDVKIREVEEV